MIIWWILLILIWPFATVLLFGAPYLPTRKKSIRQALKMMNLAPGETLLDIGSGDGAVLVEAAEAGLRAVGYELNPFLWIIAKLRTLKYGKRVKIYSKNFWVMQWPPDIDGVYVFLHTRFMKKLDIKLMSYKKPLKVVSYTFEIPDRQPAKAKNALFYYRYNERPKP